MGSCPDTDIDPTFLHPLIVAPSAAQLSLFFYALRAYIYFYLCCFDAIFSAKAPYCSIFRVMMHFLNTAVRARHVQTALPSISCRRLLASQS